MPGSIREILKKEGDLLDEKEIFLILESMKMYNELRGEKEGRIRKIFVSEGEWVKKDQPLIEIE